MTAILRTGAHAHSRNNNRPAAFQTPKASFGKAATEGGRYDLPKSAKGEEPASAYRPPTSAAASLRRAESSRLASLSKGILKHRVNSTFSRA
jgi:hypothetical protein